MFNIISLVIILVSLGIILAIVVKKLPLLASFDVSENPEEKAAETKDKIMEQRLKRKAKFFLNKFMPYGKLLKGGLKERAESLLDKFKGLEEKYKKKVKKDVLVTKEEHEDFEQSIDTLLKEADQLTDKEEYEEAEKKYIEILSMDAKNTEAYYGLGWLYFLQRSYEEAKQTYAHILKLDKDNDKAFFALAEVCERIEDFDQAISFLEKALKIEPNNPKYLDLLVKLNIDIKKKEQAKEALKKLKEVNPENQKIKEFEGQIKEL